MNHQEFWNTEGRFLEKRLLWYLLIYEISMSPANWDFEITWILDIFDDIGAFDIGHF